MIADYDYAYSIRTLSADLKYFNSIVRTIIPYLTIFASKRMIRPAPSSPSNTPAFSHITPNVTDTLAITWTTTFKLQPKKKSEKIRKIAQNTKKK